MKIITSPKNGIEEQRERLRQLLDVPKYPLWLKILAFAVGLLFVMMLIWWAIWSMQTVVIPDIMGWPRGRVTQPHP